MIAKGTIINGRMHHFLGSWTWSEGAADERDRDNFDLECSVCSFIKKEPDRKKALDFIKSHTKCPKCGIQMAAMDPW